MSLRKPLRKMTVAEYLESEKNGTVRHEYLDGDIYAMSGASKRHNLVANNLNSGLREGLRGGPCQVFFVDVKVYIEAVNTFYYPDVVVACDPEDNDEYFVRRPVLVVEVQSPSTAAIDRREKLMAYRKLESLREYLLLSQDAISAEVFRRDEQGDWWSEQLGSDSELRLESVGLALPLQALYEGVEFAP
ncbi:MAG TPA: Uma2 family endonuclease [Blastocatellia bacterium]|nr:Uma2 family endonuclease [Blastocatellia bacterium]